MSYYPGLGVLALAMVGVWRGPRHLGIIIGAVIVCCWILALGDAGQLYPLVKKVFPWIGVARFPVKFTVLPAFLLPLLAASAVSGIADGDIRARCGAWLSTGVFLMLAAGLVAFARAWPLTFDTTDAMAWNAAVRILLLLALVAALYWMTKLKNSRFRLFTQFLALGILLADLFTHNPGITPTLPSSVLAPGIWQTNDQAPVALGAGRIMDSPQGEQQMLFSYVTDPQLDLLGKRLGE